MTRCPTGCRLRGDVPGTMQDTSLLAGLPAAGPMAPPATPDGIIRERLRGLGYIS